MNARGAGGQEVRVKLVDLDRYTVAKKKAGWLTVKDKKGKKARWVVLHENTLRWFEEADEKSQPAGIMDDVDAAKMTVKASKKGDSFSIELKGGKVKVVLMCENDVMWERFVPVAALADFAFSSRNALDKVARGTSAWSFWGSKGTVWARLPAQARCRTDPRVHRGGGTRT